MSQRSARSSGGPTFSGPAAAAARARRLGEADAGRLGRVPAQLAQVLARPPLDRRPTGSARRGRSTSRARRCSSGRRAGPPTPSSRPTRRRPGRASSLTPPVSHQHAGRHRVYVLTGGGRPRKAWLARRLVVSSSVRDRRACRWRRRAPVPQPPQGAPADRPRRGPTGRRSWRAAYRRAVRPIDKSDSGPAAFRGGRPLKGRRPLHRTAPEDAVDVGGRRSVKPQTPPAAQRSAGPSGRRVLRAGRSPDSPAGADEPAAGTEGEFRPARPRRTTLDAEPAVPTRPRRRGCRRPRPPRPRHGPGRPLRPGHGAVLDERRRPADPGPGGDRGVVDAGRCAADGSGVGLRRPARLHRDH